MNTLVNRVTPNITTMIRMDHSHVFALFHRYRAGTSVQRKDALVRNACLALEVHAQLEEEIFYPALREVMGEDPDLRKSEPEHDEMRRLIGELRQGGPQDDRFLELMRIVMHHVADEESRLLPAAERLLGDRLGELGAAMTRRRIELVKPHAGEMAVTAAQSFPVVAATGAVLLAAGALALGTKLWPRKRSAWQRYRPRLRA